MKKITLVIVSTIFLLAMCTVTAIAVRPATVQPVTFSASLCTTGGEKADCTVDARMVENGVDLPHYEGTLTLNGVQHIDFLTRFTSVKTTLFDRLKDRFRVQGIGALSTRVAFPHDITVPYKNFYTPFAGNLYTCATLEWLEKDDQRYVWVRYWNMTMDRTRDYYGPAQDALEAEQVKEIFERSLENGEIL